jgi:hypothetical protein
MQQMGCGGLLPEFRESWKMAIIVVQIAVIHDMLK